MRSNLLLLTAGIIVSGAGAAMPRGDETRATTTLPAMTASAPAAAAAPADPLSARVDEALAALRGSVKRLSHESALELAFGAYFAYRAEHPEDVRNPYLYFVDYGLSNRTPRGYVFDMEKLQLVEGPFNVAHGRGSGPRNGVPTRFTNTQGSASSSLGLYLAQETYAFSGKSAGVRYRSIGLRMKGLSGSWNSAARARGVVVHGAPYVTSKDAGRSEGCPAMEEFRAQRLIPMLANGGMVFVFSPDAEWMREDPWAGRLAE